MTLADSGYPLLDVFWTMTVFFLWLSYIWLLVAVLSDIFRRHDINGGGKALWVVFVVVMPFLGAFVYLIAEGGDMQDRQPTRAQRDQSQSQVNDYAAPPAHNGRTSGTEQIVRAKQLLDSGAITSEEFAALKQKALAG